MIYVKLLLGTVLAAAFIDGILGQGTEVCINWLYCFAM